MPEKNIIVGISGSPRNRIEPQALLDILNHCDDFDALYDIIYKLGGDRKISNSEGILLASLYGAREMGAGIEHIALNKFFSKNQAPEEQAEIFKQTVQQASGLILSSPVYFGDRSSLIANFISTIKDVGASLPLGDKAVGSISVGAKRNGGQETTNVFALFDCMDLGACIVGNGPPTSQYGGTAVGGAMGAIIDDAFGLKTSRGTGQRVALLSRAISLDPAQQEMEQAIEVVFLIARKDRHDYFINKIKALPFSDNTRVSVVDISSMDIAPCRACTICPSGDLSREYTCVIPSLSKSGRNDDMEHVHSFLSRADAVVLSYYNGPDADIDLYQRFMERTRFVRRNNYELTNRVFSTFYESNNPSDIFPLRSLSSFLRHNLFLIGPFYNAFWGNKKEILENIDPGLYVRRLETMARKAKLTRKLGYNTIETSYSPIGYPGENK